MDKKIKFSEQPTRVKIIYTAVIAVLCVTAIVIGIVSAASKKDDQPDDTQNPPIENGENDDEGGKEENEGEKENNAPEKLTMVSPVVGVVTKYHSIETPVFSTTLNEWRVHTGIDISAEEGAEVYASAAGVVSAVYSHPLLGKTVEITHRDGVISCYSNLDSSGITVKEGDAVASGAKIGTVGDTSLSELADEAHLHFEIKVDGASVNPLDYISEESKEASLGINEV